MSDMINENVDTMPQDNTVGNTEDLEVTNNGIETNDSSNTNTTPQEQQEQPKFKIKYNHEERELSYDEAVQLAQKGMNYDKIYEKLNQLESDPRLGFIEELARQYNMSPNEYIEAVRQAQEQEKINELVQQNIPEEYARELLESKKFRQQFEAEKKAQQEQASKQQEYQDFLNAYPDVNANDIPQSVWDKVGQGMPLKYAYMEYDNQSLKSKFQAQQTNTENASSTTPSVTGNGQIDHKDYFTKEEVQANQHNKEWIRKNLDKIDKSMARW